MEPKKHPHEMLLSEIVAEIVNLKKSSQNQKSDQRLSDFESKINDSGKKELRAAIVIINQNIKILGESLSNKMLGAVNEFLVMHNAA